MNNRKPDNMRFCESSLRTSLAALSLLLAVPGAAAQANVPWVRDGEAAFVVSHIAYALGPEAADSGTCPQGMTRNLQEIAAMTTEGRQRAGESDADYADRLKAAAKVLGTGPGGEDLCMNPEAGKPDPYFRTVQRSDVRVDGIDLDGEASTDDFLGEDGSAGIDNQWYRVVGCSRSYQPAGQSNSFNISMLTGSWGILVRLRGVDDIRNDEHVDVDFYANADPIRLSPAREPLAYASYSPHSEPRYRASTTGSIHDGVLTTVPVDADFQNEVNSMYLNRPLRAARLEVSISADGELDGYLAGYTPVEAMYDMAYGYRNGWKLGGELAPLRLRSGSANGAAFVLGHTCTGAWYALHDNADAFPDPASGKNTAISTQYRIQAIPAFIIEQQVTPKSPALAGEGRGE